MSVRRAFATLVCVSAILILTIASAYAGTECFNPGFEDAEGDSARGWKTGGSGYEIATDSSAPFNGTRSLRIRRIGEGTSGSFSQGFEASTEVGKRYRLSGHIRTDNVADGHAVLWLRVDGEEGYLSIDNMSDRGVTGTSPWLRHEVTLYVVPGATRVVFGGLLRGRGEAWFDDLAVEEIPEPERQTSREASTYLDVALDRVEAHLLGIADINWPQIRDTAHRIARGAQTPSETYPAIRQAIGMLRDGHSRFMTPAEIKARIGSADRAPIAPKETPLSTNARRLLSGKIAYIQVRSFRDLSTTVKQAFASTLQDVIRKLDAHEPHGWIVDLRLNDGGTMWPMLAGIGPLVGDGTAGWLIGKNSERIVWGYRDGASWTDGQEMVRVDSPYSSARSIEANCSSHWVANSQLG